MGPAVHKAQPTAHQMAPAGRPTVGMTRRAPTFSTWSACTLLWCVPARSRHNMCLIYFRPACVFATCELTSFVPRMLHTACVFVICKSINDMPLLACVLFLHASARRHRACVCISYDRVKHAWRALLDQVVLSSQCQLGYNLDKQPSGPFYSLCQSCVTSLFNWQPKS